MWLVVQPSAAADADSVELAVGRFQLVGREHGALDPEVLDAQLLVWRARRFVCRDGDGRLLHLVPERVAT